MRSRNPKDPLANTHTRRLLGWLGTANMFTTEASVLDWISSQRFYRPYFLCHTPTLTMGMWFIFWDIANENRVLSKFLPLPLCTYLFSYFFSSKHVSFNFQIGWIRGWWKPILVWVPPATWFMPPKAWIRVKVVFLEGNANKYVQGTGKVS